MDIIERDKKYNEYLLNKIPKTKPWPSLFHAFWVGGLICCVGEAIKDGFMLAFPYLSQSDAATLESVVVIFIASFLTAIGLYDKLGAYAGAGSIIPISGFSNSITSPAMEFRREGIIFGLCAKMFVIAGPVIVSGVVVSLICGVISLVL